MLHNQAVTSQARQSVQDKAKLDLSRPILREIFNSNEDFTNGTIKDITPKNASALLECNIKNRKARTRHVDWLAAQMAAGYWKFTGEPIKMNSEGILVDGQHRLMAVVQSGTTQRFLVIGGLDDKIIDVIDTGISRSAGDVLNMNGVENSTNLAAVCRRVLNFKMNRKSASFIGGDGKRAPGTTSADVICNSRIYEEVSTDPRYAAAVRAAAKLYGGSRILSLSQYGLLYFLFSEKDPDSAWEFLSKLAYGIGLSEDSPIYALRQRMERERDTKIKYADSLKMYWFFYCWNRFRQGKTLAKLVTPDKIEIPDLL